MESNHFLSVVIPAKDEQENISRLITEIYYVLSNYHHFEVVIVDDGSSDYTLRTAVATAHDLSCPIQVVRHATSVGQSMALQTGIRRARGDLIITMDGDGQNDPSDIPLLLDRASTHQGQDFCIAGYRRNRKDTAWKRFQSRVANRVRAALLHDGVPDTGCGLKLFPKTTFLKLPWFNHGHRFIPALVRGIGGEIDVVEVNHRNRLQGSSNYNAWNRGWAGLLDLAGVMWLLHRTRVAQIAELQETEPG